jgi:uncharacterized delta-60 repeat protein
MFALLAVPLLFVVGLAEGAPGTLDPSFGGSGVVTTFVSTAGASVTALVLQPDGKIVAVGDSTPPTFPVGYEQIALARYEPSGSPDPSFGSGGIVTTPIAGGDAYANAAVLQPDGKILVTGYQTTPPAGSVFALVRYNPDGSLDTSFGSGGVVTTRLGGVNSEAFGVLLQADGKIVAGGEATNSTGVGSALVRYMPDGSLDGSFGSGGIVLSTQPGENGFNALALQPDGKILGVGQDAPLTRYNTDGTLDTSFGGGGVAAAPTPQASALALQSDGKIVVAGQSYNGSRKVFAFARANPDGSPDAGFGSGGAVTTQIGSGDAAASAVAVQPDGKIVGAGTSQGGNGSTGQDLFTLARYNPDGSLDSTFGSGGIVTTLTSSWMGGSAAAAALQPDGKIDVAGWAMPNGWVTAEFAVARYLGGSTLTVARSGNGSGSVTSKPAGIDCGSTCSSAYAYGATVTLTAVPAAGSVFAGWSGACSGTGACAVTLNADTSVTATFDLATNILTIAKAGKGHGTITSSPTGIRCGSICSRAYAYGATVTIVAAPASGSAFKGWSGACSGTWKRCSLTMRQARSATATFRRTPACVVPKLQGQSLKLAERKLKRARCHTGKIRHTYSKISKGHVISQTPPARRRLRNGAKVNLVISSGRRP